MAELPPGRPEHCREKLLQFHCPKEMPASKRSLPRVLSPQSLAADQTALARSVRCRQPLAEILDRARYGTDKLTIAPLWPGDDPQSWPTRRKWLEYHASQVFELLNRRTLR